MKKQFLFIAFLAGSLHLSAHNQQKDTGQLYQKKRHSKMEIEALVGYYAQDGNNSAVTGGKGTEELTVFSVQTLGKITYKEKRQFSYSIGADMITSASTDKIDFISSSPSYKDFHVYGSLGYGNQINERWQVSAKAGFGIESDYLAIPVGVSLVYQPISKMYTLSASINASFDDLRWGRLQTNADTLVLTYPAELRGVESYNLYHRNTVHLKTAYTQTINKRLLVGIAPEFIYQQGLLSTPFHRAYFNDGSVHLERLPNTRFRFPIAFWANTFLGGSHILRARYQFYIDSWGVASHTIQASYTKQINAQWALFTLLRYYAQQGTSYFKAFGEHQVASVYHTSDYDLSTMQSYKASLGVLYHTLQSKVQQIGLRYAYYHTSNELAAHILTLSVQLGYL